jgi:hypothetical protein
MLLDAEKVIELSVADVESTDYLLVGVLLDSDVVECTAAHSEVSVPLAIEESPEFHLDLDVGEVFVLFLVLECHCFLHPELIDDPLLIEHHIIKLNIISKLRPQQFFIRLNSLLNNIIVKLFVNHFNIFKFHFLCRWIHIERNEKKFKRLFVENHV